MAGLTNADKFQFQNLRGDLLELHGQLLNMSRSAKAGLVEKSVMRRAGALHQRVGSPPQRCEYRVLLAGPDCRDKYRKILAVMADEPEGRLTDPRLGDFPAVLDDVGDQEAPENEIDAIYCTLKFIETGLRAAPKPAPAAKAQAAAATAATTQAFTALSSDATLRQLGATYAAQAAGYQVAIQAAETGLGLLPDVDASLLAMSVTAEQLQRNPAASQDVRRSAAVALAYALTARNRYLAGKPPLVQVTLRSTEGITALCQRLYGSRALDNLDTIRRLNRIRRPYGIVAGTVLLVPDPTVLVTT